MTTWYARNDVPYSGGEKQLSITFPYIKKEHIKVFVNDVETTEYHFLNESQIFLDCSLKKGDMMSVRRNTPIDEKMVNFTNTSILNAEKQNLAQTQLLNAVQEIYDNNIEFQDETTAQVAAFEARVEEVEATTAESANIVAESAVLSASALANSEQAVTTANSAHDTATEALLTSEQANSFAVEARDSATIALDIAVTSGNKVDVFEESIDTVLEAADKISVLEGAVGEATEAAQAAQEAVQAVGEMIDAIDGKANVDLDNLSEAGQAKLDEKANAVDVLDKSQITNCLLEVPQNIKLELNDGVLTLKAGSIVTVPNGFEADGTTPKFDYVTIENDAVGSYSVTTIGSCLLTLNSNTNTLAFGASNGNNTYYFSGNTAPANPVKEYYWYDTANNLLKRYNGTAWVDGYTLPIALMSYNGTGVITSIDQVFNGMGYIGSTVWVDKGVKGLIPNGRNEDGSLNNIEFSVSQVMVRTYTTNTFNNYPLWVNINGILSAVPEVKNTLQSGHYGIYEDENVIKDPSGNKIKAFKFGLVSYNQGTATSFQPKQPFRAVDYNDFDTKANKEDIYTKTESDSRYVNVTGDTMTGNLNIERNASSYLGVCHTGMKIGDGPAERVNLGGLYIRANDSSANNLAGIVQGYIPAKSGNLTGVGLQIITRHPNNTAWGAGLSLVTFSDGTATFDFPKCTTKATTTSTASGSKVAVITQNYKNGNSWYRVWSDGWIEQGGIVESIPVNSTKTVTFLKAFTTTNYYINCNQPMKATYSFETCGITTRATTSFTVHQKSYNGDGGAFNSAWYACGY